MYQLTLFKISYLCNKTGIFLQCSILGSVDSNNSFVTWDDSRKKPGQECGFASESGNYFELLEKKWKYQI